MMYLCSQTQFTFKIKLEIIKIPLPHSFKQGLRYAMLLACRPRSPGFPSGPERPIKPLDNRKKQYTAYQNQA